MPNTFNFEAFLEACLFDPDLRDIFKTDADLNDDTKVDAAIVIIKKIVTRMGGTDSPITQNINRAWLRSMVKVSRDLNNDQNVGT